MRPREIIGAKKARTRVLNDDELRALWKAAEGMGYPYGPLFQLLALTGQRKSEVAEARWSEIDLVKRLWENSRRADEVGRRACRAIIG